MKEAVENEPLTEPSTEEVQDLVLEETTAEATTPEAQVVQLQQEIESLRDTLTRQVADFQNYRRRTEQETLRSVQYGKENAISHLLEVLDDLERSVLAIEQADDDHPNFSQVKTGVEMVYQKFVQQLAKLDVHPIEALHQPFDEQLHEALMQQPATAHVAAGHVLQELQKGYKMGNRVLRHSKVIVAV